MANAYEWSDVLDLFLRDKLRQVDTFKPAIVTTINGNRLDARMLTQTKYLAKQVPQPDVFDVPFQIMSAKKGNVAITMPISPGDLVMIAFSDRDFGDLLDYRDDQLQEIRTAGDGQSLAPQGDELYTHRYNAIFAMPCWYTEPTAIPVNTDDIVIKNHTTQINIDPSGNVTMAATKVKMTGNLEVDGDITAANVTASSEVTAGTVALSTHIHGGSATAATGPVSNTQAPIP